GCVLVGKSAMHEMAYGFTSRNPHYGDCHNPWDLARIPGGSSGGNGAALATGMAFAAVGGDTGGSNRQPAALCGVVGVKVTYRWCWPPFVLSALWARGTEPSSSPRARGRPRSLSDPVGQNAPTVSGLSRNGASAPRPPITWLAN